MTTIGIIAEYNPFHCGHDYHIQKTREKTGADFFIAVMSGQFLQRGEPALFDKWTRTRMALSSGIDLVIELPFVFASQDARGFANAGIQLLDSLGIVDYVSFGCEDDQLELLTEIAELIRKEPALFQKTLREGVKKGENFPRNRQRAIIKYIQESRIHQKNISLDKVVEILDKPNNILALEYLASLHYLKSSIKPLLIKRIGSSYSQEEIKGRYSSATAIRKKIVQKYYEGQGHTMGELQEMMPDSSFEVMCKVLTEGFNPVILSDFEQAIFTNLRRMSLSDIQKIHAVEEGLENKLKQSAIFSDVLEVLIRSIKSKRYTRTRIQRILIHTLFQVTKSEVRRFNRKGPLYCRILGMTDKGKTIFKGIKAKSILPAIIKLKNFYKMNKRIDQDMALKMLDYDVLATDLYMLGYKSGLPRLGRRDFTENIIILDSKK